MAKPGTLFGATYAQSRKIFKLENLKNGGGFGRGGQVQLRYRLLFLFAFGGVAGLILWMFGTGLSAMAVDAVNHPGDVHYITDSTAVWMGRGNLLLQPLFKVWFVVLEFLLVLNVLIPKTMPAQLLYVQVVMLFVILPLLTIVILPLALGGTIVSMGWLGLAVVLFAGVAFLVVEWLKGAQDTRTQLYGKGAGRQVDFSQFDYWAFRISVGLIVVCIVDGYTLKLGFPQPSRSNLWSLLLGLVPIFYFGLFAVLTRALFTQMVSNYYLLKYGESYKADYKISDKDWYGWLKARRLAKRRAKQVREATGK